MAATPNSKQILLHVEQITSIRSNHSPTADAIQKIVDYINKNLVPPQGTKVQPK
jgi:hypothetical protein